MKSFADTAVRIEMRSGETVALGWKQVGAVARQVGLSSADLTRLLAAISELTRCIVIEGHGGTMIVRKVSDEARQGLEVVFVCHEPAGREGSGCGTCGAHAEPRLCGAAPLVDDFHVETAAGIGTTITVRKWAEARGNNVS